MQTDPFFTDGRSAILNPLVECLNIVGIGTPFQRYEYLGDSIDREAIEKEHTDGDGSPLGSDTREGFEKGAINIQLNLLTDTVARPGHIIALSIGAVIEYYIAGKFGRSRQRNEIVKGAIGVKRAYNPIIVSLLSAAFGQRRSFAQAAGALTAPITTAPTVVNTRATATLAYSLAGAPGFVLPAWLSINATTGVLSGTAVAGTHEFDVVLTDTLATEETRVGFGRMVLVIT